MVLHEGLEELRIKSTWTVGPYHAPYSQKHHRAGGIAPQDAGQLFDPTVAGKITLWTNALQLDTREGTEATFRMEADDVEYIRALAVRLEVASRVPILRIKVRVDPCCNTRYRRHQEKGRHLDLAHLTRLPFQLGTHEFEMVHVKQIAGIRVENWTFCHSFFAEEMERVGKVLVGEEGILTLQTSPGLEYWYGTLLFTYSNTRK
ncbi:hypothetical protein ST47_g6049 [Ascochyta rabiei]|uniref:Uncharacterized protein n=1 Tax=Didymella rabiei TaxID=5454 RepID=A0A163CYR0_DIDRA|nr:hypothetical protein ST47_g6049 [Ascochyta rabiei]